VAGICLAALFVAAAILQVTTSNLPERTGVPYIAPPLVQPGIVETIDLPPLRPAGGPMPVAATDGDLPEVNQPLETVQLFPDGALVVHSMSFDSLPLKHKANGVRYTLPDRTVQGKPDLGPPGKTWFDVTRFGPEPALVAVRQLRNGQLGVTVLAAKAGLPRLAAGVAPAPRPKGPRTAAVATWTGSLPDLFVLDRGSNRVPVVVRIYSGESGFRKLLLAAALPLVESDPEVSSLDVARIQPGLPPDIILVKRKGASGRPEAHIITGSSSFRQFDQHLVVQAPPLPASEQVVLGTRVGQVAVYLVVLAGPRHAVSLMTLPYRANVPS
jgi:hypothetical protein